MNLFEASPFAATILNQSSGDHLNLGAFIIDCGSTDGDQIPADSIFHESSIINEATRQAADAHNDDPSSAAVDDCNASTDIKRVRRKRSSLLKNANQQPLGKCYKCDGCDESFNELRNLNLHKTVHTEPPLYCGQCHKVFARCSSYLGHIKTHFKNDLIACKFCSQTFNHYALYENHLRIAHSDKYTDGMPERKRKAKSTKRGKKCQFKCDVCNKLFSRSSTLRRHERIHRNERPYECNVCHQRFHQSGSLKTHQVIHSGQKPYLCEFCLSRFNQKGNLNLHIQRCHSMSDAKDKKRFSCMHCLCSFSKLNSLQTHMTKAHAITDSDRKRNDHDYEIQNEIKEVMKHLAEIQDAVLPAIDSHPTDVLDDHQYMDLNAFANKLNFESSVNSSLNRNPFFDRSAEYVTLVDEDHQHKGKLVQRLVRQVFRNNIRWLVCKYCPKEFRRPSDLMRHFRVHTKERPFACPMCPRTFSVRTTLTVHMNRTHSGDSKRPRKKFHRCPNCLQIFKNNNSLDEHECPKSNSNKQPRITDELKNFIDRNVPTDDLATFYNEIELNGREMITLNDICNEIIPEVPEHLADHASPLELKYFQCNLCPAIFKQKCHLNDHTVVHTGFKTHQCDICMKFYAKKSVLRRHKLIHQRKWPCKTCRSEFTNMEDLKEHSLMHLAELSSFRDKPDISAELLEDNHQAALADLQEIIASESDLVDLPEPGDQFIGVGRFGDKPISVAQLPALNALPSLNDHNYNSTSAAIILDDNTGLFAADSTSVVGVAVNTDGDSQLHSFADDHQYFLILDGNADNLIFSDLTGDIDLAVNDDIDAADITATIPTISGNENQNAHLIDTKLETFAASSQAWLMPGGDSDHVEIIDADTLAIWQEPMSADMLGDGALQFVRLESLTDKDDELHQRLSNISVVKVDSQELSLGKDVKGHFQRVNEVEPLKRNHCQICDRTFKKPIDYRRHMRTHTGERPFKCDKCSRSFSLRCILLTHLKRHSDVKEKHVCHVCQKVFSAKVSLNVHLRLHTGSKPFKCDYCDLRFRTSGHRIAHQQCHLRQAAKQKVQPTDVKTRKAKSKLKTIEDVVNVATWESTKGAAPSTPAPKVVEKTKDVKPKKPIPKPVAKSKMLFSCPSCAKAFNKRSLLLRHLVVHTQEKHFKCDVCNSTFTQKSSLKTHYQRTHAEIKDEHLMTLLSLKSKK